MASAPILASSTHDVIVLRNLSLHAPVGPDAWHRRGKPQPVLLSLRINYDVTRAATSDDVSQTLDYGKLCKKITAIATNPERKDGFEGLDTFSLAVRRSVLVMLDDTAAAAGPGRIDVDVRLPKGVLRADQGVRFRETYMWRGNCFSRHEMVGSERVLGVQGVKCACIVGVNKHERVEKQVVVLHLTVEGNGTTRFMECFQDATRVVVERVEGSSFQTVEALATFIARILTMEFGIESCRVCVEKPSALASVEGAGVEITRSRKFFETSKIWSTGMEGGSGSGSMEEDRVLT